MTPNSCMVGNSRNGKVCYEDSAFSGDNTSADNQIKYLLRTGILIAAANRKQRLAWEKNDTVLDVERHDVIIHRQLYGTIPCPLEAHVV